MMTTVLLAFALVSQAKPVPAPPASAPAVDPLIAKYIGYAQVPFAVSQEEANFNEAMGAFCVRELGRKHVPKGSAVVPLCRAFAAALNASSERMATLRSLSETREAALRAQAEAASNAAIRAQAEASRREARLRADLAVANEEMMTHLRSDQARMDADLQGGAAANAAAERRERFQAISNAVQAIGNAQMQAAQIKAQALQPTPPPLHLTCRPGLLGQTDCEQTH